MSREETIAEKLARLYGAARQAWLRKWAKRIKLLIPEHVDPAIVVGYPYVDERVAERILNEYCRDLTESECYSKLIEVFSGAVPRRRSIFDKDYQQYIERKLRIASTIERSLGIPIDPDYAEEIYKKIFEGRTHWREVCELIESAVRTRWIGFYGEEPPEEDKRAVAEACDRARELWERRARPLEWYKVLEPVFTTREQLVPSIKPYMRLVKQLSITKDMEYYYSNTPKHQRILMSEGKIREKFYHMEIIYMGDKGFPADFLTSDVLDELTGMQAYIGYLSVGQASEMWYFHKFYHNREETPILCLYSARYDIFMACDRPVMLVAYYEELNKARVFPLPLFKQIRGLSLEDTLA